MPVKDRYTAFKEKYQLKYGLKISHRDPTTNMVDSVACQFCLFYGREERVGGKRARTTNVKHFKHPFRVDLFEKHMSSQHSEKWREYVAASEHEKRSMFEGAMPLKGSSSKAEVLVSHAPMQELINKEIVDVVIDALLYDPDNDDEADEWLSNGFESVPGDAMHYVIDIANSLQYHLVMDSLATGASFASAASQIQSLKARTGLEAIELCTPSQAAKFARFSCALGLQKLSNLLKTCWAFSISLNVSTHMSMNILDVRIRLCQDIQVYNFHLLALPLLDTHTGEEIYETCAKVLDALCPDWKVKTIGLTVDGERGMAKCVDGVASRFLSIAWPGFYRIWSGANQLKLIMEESYKNAYGNTFTSTLSDLIWHLRREKKFVKEISTQAKALASTRWEEMAQVSSWIKRNRFDIKQYLDENNFTRKPSPLWWITLMIVNEIANEAYPVLKKLEGPGLAPSEQRGEISKLRAVYASWIDVAGPLQETERHVYINSEEWRVSKDGKFAGRLDKTRSLIEDMVMVEMEFIETADAAVIKRFVDDICLLLLNLVAGLAATVANRYESDGVCEARPPIMPYQFAQMRGPDFGLVLRRQKDRLRKICEPTRIAMIEEDFSALRKAYAKDQALHMALHTHDAGNDFEQGWKIVRGRFRFLQEFAGGLATTIADPATSTDDDFSAFRNIRDLHRSSLTSLSVEGVMYLKQQSLLNKLANSKTLADDRETRE